jgi:hypothetical protein
MKSINLLPCQRDKIKILGFSLINLFFQEISNILLVQNCSSTLLSISKIRNQSKFEVIFHQNG